MDDDGNNIFILLIKVYHAIMYSYTNISRIMQRCAKSKSDASRVVTLYLSEKSALFKRVIYILKCTKNIMFKDNNFGLVKVLINATKENALKRLANV